MKTRRIASAILCLITILALLPTAALAAGTTVAIGGVALPAGSYYVNGANGAVGTVSATNPGNWNAYYDGVTLKLNDLFLSPTNYGGLYGIHISGGDLTLALMGTSRASFAGSGSYLAAFEFSDANTLTVQGAGSLTARADNPSGQAYGINISYGNLLMKSGTLTGEAAEATTYTGFGVRAGGRITVEGGTLIGKPIDGKACYSGITCTTLNVSGGVLNGEGNQFGIYTDNAISISGGNVTGVATWFGIYSYNASIFISGGAVRGDGYTTGALANSAGSVHISGGDVLFTSAISAVFPTLDLAGYSIPHIVTASAARNGSPTTPYIPGNLLDYRYLRIGPPQSNGAPKTGDATPLALYGALLLLSGAGLAAARFTRRRKRAE